MDELKTLPEPNRKYESETNSDSIADELRAARNETEKENMLTELYYGKTAMVTVKGITTEDKTKTLRLRKLIGKGKNKSLKEIGALGEGAKLKIINALYLTTQDKSGSETKRDHLWFKVKIIDKNTPGNKLYGETEGYVSAEYIKIINGTDETKEYNILPAKKSIRKYKPTAPRNAPQVAPQVAPRNAPQVAPQVAPRNAPQVAPQVAPRNAPQVAPQVAPRNAPQVAPQVAPRNAPQVAPQVAPRNAPQVAPQVAPRNAPQVAPRSRMEATEGQIKKSIIQALPNALNAAQKISWAEAIIQAMKKNNIPMQNENIAFILGQIEREGNYREDPECPELRSMFDRTIKVYGEKYGIPDSVMNTVSAPGKAFFDEIYQEYNLGSVRTEGQLETKWRLIMKDKDSIRKRFEEKWWARLIPKNVCDKIFEKMLTSPVKTVGAMQVSVEKATAIAKRNGDYPGNEEAFRAMLYRKETNLIYGIKEIGLLLSPYQNKGFTQEERIGFYASDYNLGRFASRNAAIQRDIAELTGETISLDGDLLPYTEAGIPDPTKKGQTEEAIIRYAWNHPDLNRYSENEIRGFLTQEKTQNFESTPIYQAIVRDIQKKHQGESGYIYKYATLPKDAKAGGEDARAKFGKSITNKGYVGGSMARFNKYYSALEKGGR